MKRGTKYFAVLPVIGALLAGACEDDSRTGPGEVSDHYYPTSSVVFGEDSQSTYISLLRSLGSQEIDLDQSREFAGWSDMWVHEGKVFIADGEAPELTRYSVTETGSLVEKGRLSFQDHGAETAAFWTNMFVAPDKAYLFVIDERKVVVWNPSAMEITGSFSLPELADRPGGQVLSVPTTERSSVVRGNRAYVPTQWANWEDVSISEDSIILVIDTDTDTVIDTLSVPCPNINVATTDEDQNIYFSNWVYSVPQTLIGGKAGACAVRIQPGSDALDPDWSLTFADVTGGREAAAMRYLGDRQALISVFYDDRVEITAETDPNELADSANWRSWTLNIDTFEATELDGLDWHAGGFYASRIDGRTHVFIPSEDYSSTEAYELFSPGSVEHRWDATGWVTRLFKLR